MRIVSFVFGLLFIAAGILAFLSANSAFQECVAATLLVVATICVATGFILEAIQSTFKRADKRTDEQRELLVSLLNELNKQTIALGKIIEEADESAGDRFNASEEARKYHEKALVFLARADSQMEHNNNLLTWLGKSKPDAVPESS